MIDDELKFFTRRTMKFDHVISQHMGCRNGGISIQGIVVVYVFRNYQSFRLSLVVDLKFGCNMI